MCRVSGGLTSDISMECALSSSGLTKNQFFNLNSQGKIEKLKQVWGGVADLSLKCP